jgi:glycosyltransferase involved in cell wall biosynthesis
MNARGESLTILIPSFNDWAALRLLLPGIDRAFADSRWSVSVLIVDDGSTDPVPEDWAQDFASIQSIEILHLRCNLGHQRAIALGLYHEHEFGDADAVIVMDGDGQDRPRDLPALLREFENAGRREVIFAARSKRMESLLFQCFYRAYQGVHRMLTGIGVRVGNFSAIPRALLVRLIASPDLWNHYAAAVFRARLPRRLVPLDRGARLQGRSKMNFVSLLTHGLSAISVFSDQVSARLLTASAAFSVFSLAAILASSLIPGWTRATTAWLIGLMLQSLTFAILFAFLIASRRSSAGFILQRDAPYFILGKTPVRSKAPARAAR